MPTSGIRGRIVRAIRGQPKRRGQYTIANIKEAVMDDAQKRRDIARAIQQEYPRLFAHLYSTATNPDHMLIVEDHTRTRRLTITDLDNWRKQLERSRIERW